MDSVNTTALLNARSYEAATLADRKKLVKAQLGDLKLAKDATMTIHLLVTMVQAHRNGNVFDGVAMTDSAIADSLHTNGKRVSYARALVQRWEALAHLTSKTVKPAEWLVPDSEIVSQVVNVVSLNIKACSIESLKKAFAPSEDDKRKSDDSSKTFDPDLYFAIGVKAMQNRGYTRDQILASLVAAIPSAD